MSGKPNPTPKRSIAQLEKDLKFYIKSANEAEKEAEQAFLAIDEERQIWMKSKDEIRRLEQELQEAKDVIRAFTRIINPRRL